ncbi:sugar transferase, partial [Campylobacter jejuni]|nr:sugar transferase [Campylobacter jejuni]
SHGAGAFTLGQFFYHLFKINILDYFCGGDGDIRYYKFYNKLLELKDKRNIITINDIDPSWYGNQHKRDKLFSSFQKITPILFQIRDPIELIKHAYGR